MVKSCDVSGYIINILDRVRFISCVECWNDRKFAMKRDYPQLLSICKETPILYGEKVDSLLYCECCYNPIMQITIE